MAYYHADNMPPPDSSAPVVVNRKEAVASKVLLETPAEALTRRAQGGQTPEHYTPTPMAGNGNRTSDVEKTTTPWGAELSNKRRRSESSSGGVGQ